MVEVKMTDVQKGGPVGFLVYNRPKEKDIIIWCKAPVTECQSACGSREEEPAHTSVNMHFASNACHPDQPLRGYGDPHDPQAR